MASSLLQCQPMRTLGFAVVALVSLAEPRPADACSPPRCWPGFLTPGDAATVPANLPAIHWRPMYAFDGTASDPAKVKLATAGGTALAMTATKIANGDYLLVPDQSLVAGTDYVLRDGNTCGDLLGPTSTFTAAPAAPLPTALGALTASAQGIAALGVETTSGSCSVQVEADQSLVDLALSADALPWRDAFHFETLADGIAWSPQSSINSPNPPGTSWRGRAADRVYTVCSSPDDSLSPGLAPGPHAITMRATLPGSPTTLETAAVTVELACGVTPPDDCLTTPDRCDPDDDDDDGGGCSAGGSLGAGLGFVLVALLARRRR